MAKPIATKFSTILLAIRQRVMAWLSFPAERVIVYARSRAMPFNVQADQYVVIQPADQDGDLGINVGAGRVHARVTRTVSATLRTRLALDEAGHDLIWLTLASAGHLDYEHALTDALYEFHPQDAEGNWLVDQPIKWRRTTPPDKDDDEPEWGQSIVVADVTFTMSLNQAYV